VLVLLEKVLVVFFDVEHVVLRQRHVFTQPVDVPAATKGRRDPPTRIYLCGRVEPVVEVGLFVHVDDVHPLLVFIFRYLRVSSDERTGLLIGVVELDAPVLHLVGVSAYPHQRCPLILDVDCYASLLVKIGFHV